MLKALLRIIQEVSSASDLEAALNIVVERTKVAMRTDAVSIFLLDQNQDLVLMATEGLNKNLITKAILPWGKGLVGLVAQREQPINLDDAPKHSNFQYMPEIGEEKYHAFLGVPIIHQSQILGVLVAQQRVPRKFSEKDEAFLITLSAQLSGAIAHAIAIGLLNTFNHGKIKKDRVLYGLPGSPGIAVGRAIVVYPHADLDAVPDRKIDHVKTEQLAFRNALKAVKFEIQKLAKNISAKLPPEEHLLFDAYLKILNSRSLSRDVNREIKKGNWAQGALRQVIQTHIKHFHDLPDSYLRERASDIKDLGERILFQLQTAERRKPYYPSRTILIGEQITPAALAEVPEDRLAGIVSVTGSGNSHVAVLARALNIPAVMGVQSLPVQKLEGDELIVEGYYGQVFLSPSKSLRREFSALIKEEKELDKELQIYGELPAQTKDGEFITILINLGLIANIERSTTQGADGVGLYRTEIPFMMEEQFPTEDEQYKIYRHILSAYAPRPVMMRTLDVGGDKSLAYFPVSEENPFLGWRGIRISLDHPEIFMVQLRAMLRANAGLNNLHIMLPMISNVSEVDEAIDLIQQAHEDLNEEGIDNAFPAIGIMIEVPSAVYLAREMAKRVDFISIGSNDLTQYLLAVDRNNMRVANLYDSLHPAVLRAMKYVLEAAHQEGKHVSICGEMASDPMSVLILIGMGFDSLSMNASRMIRIKWVINNFSYEFCHDLAKRVLQLKSPIEIRQVIAEVLSNAGLDGLIRPGIR